MTSLGFNVCDILFSEKCFKWQDCLIYIVFLCIGGVNVFTASCMMQFFENKNIRFIHLFIFNFGLKISIFLWAPIFCRSNKFCPSWFTSIFNFAVKHILILVFKPKVLGVCFIQLVFPVERFHEIKIIAFMS
jgi:hypothetical protein